VIQSLDARVQTIQNRPDGTAGACFTTKQSTILSKKKENDHKIKQTITYLTHLANNISFKLAYDYVSLHTICEIANKNN